MGSKPVLKPPQHDGRPFCITSDGSGAGLAGFLSQPFTETDSAGIEHTRWHPISHTLKHTSPSGERYEPFLLEFVALKYCTDEFAPYIYRAPMEIETNCQVLRDCLLKAKLSTHHGRWKELILAHNIVNIRHCLGVENPLADGLSRMWANRKCTDADGSSWSVLPDWEAQSGIKNNILSVQPTEDAPRPQASSDIKERFTKYVFFEPVVRHLLGQNAGTNISERCRAMHRAKCFFIEDGELWRMSTKPSDRVTCRRCIPRKEGFNFTLKMHHTIEHFKSVDSLKLHIYETTF